MSTALSEMNILSLDTCFDSCSVAVRRQDGHCITERKLMRRGHAEALIPMIARTMTRAEIEFSELDRIAVTNGPGTFTGARVGLSAALGAALNHDIDIVTYSSLTCIARAAHKSLESTVDTFDGVIVARDARRDSGYWQVSMGARADPGQPMLLTLEQARNDLADRQATSQRFVGIGSGVALLGNAEILTPLAAVLPAGTIPDGIEEPDARFMLADAAIRTPDRQPAPLYLRAPDAKPSSTPPLPRLSD